jgi:electron transfer flavoprotein alpha subunit
MIASTYGPDQARGVWVFLERSPSGLESVSLELLGCARELAATLRTGVTGVLLGDNLAEPAQTAIAYGADRVLVAEDQCLARYATEPYTRVVAGAVGVEKPSILLLGATPDGRDLAGRLAVRLRTGLTADCTGLDLDPDGVLLGHTTGFGGGVTATIKCPVHRPQMATVRPGIFPLPPANPAATGEVRPIEVALDTQDVRVELLERVVQQPEVDLPRATVVIAGGRGVGGDFELLEELAHLLGGQVGATRVAVDEGWIDRQHQIGQTGFVTRPELAVVCGASGAMQFSIGIQQARTIVAVNTDPEAPIFEDADYCVVDDLNSVLPPLIARLRR